MANKSTDATKLEDVIFYSIDRAIRTYRQYSQKQMKAKGFEITIDQWLVMKALLENPGIRQQQLAELVFKDNASITRIIEILVQSEYLHREVNAADRRMTNLTVTPKGNKILQELQPLIRENRRKALSHIDERMIAQAKKMLDQIALNCKNL
jgi:DNA-binding MarR family transcriptional regulator